MCNKCYMHAHLFIRLFILTALRCFAEYAEFVLISVAIYWCAELVLSSAAIYWCGAPTDPRPTVTVAPSALSASHCTGTALSAPPLHSLDRHCTLCTGTALSAPPLHSLHRHSTLCTATSLSAPPLHSLHLRCTLCTAT